MCAQLFQIQPLGHRVPESLFFAYGSNMHPEQIKKRCAHPQRIATAYWDDHALGFFGHSAVWDGGFECAVPTPGSRLWGVVFALSNSDWECLDQWQDARFDGSGSHFHSPATVCDLAGNRYETLLYQFDVRGPACPPSNGYLDYLVAAATHSGLPSDYIAALRTTPTVPAHYPVPRQLSFHPVAAASGCDGCGDSA